MLDRGYLAASRLNLQFYLWKEALGFNIHPSIPIRGRRNLRIADLGTGTGLWLCDLAKELPPCTRLDGFDINLTNATPREWCPENVTLRRWNIFDEVPDDLVEQYDVVHLRLLILVVENSDPRPVIRNALRMLKPGGYIQWDDLNYPGTHIRKVPASSARPTPAFDELRTFVWVLELPQYLRDLGCEHARLCHYADRPELARANGDQHLLTMEEFATTLAGAGKFREAERIVRLVGEVYKESAAGAALSMPRAVCVARKSEQIRSRL
jgi:SAM-dependent methyltransferase